ncbi:hypothetical protein B0J11DRAFT_578970 [Dendryphion nanum]|uniref:PH domain-containing protein n=1 Tax=Dendryphion nanum TaxID=256645 RepID=A0A9P9DYH8_9PLEO|nr:hypothetical protein B0J11DRAFT_578970 [Dendryphion nanum]
MSNPSHSSRNDTTFRWRWNRSSANLLDHAAPIPLNPSTSMSPPKLERSASKMSLFNLFSRPKVEKARGHTEVGLAIPMEPQQPPKPAPVSPPKSSLRVNPPPFVQQAHRSRSRMSLKPASVRRHPIDWDPPPLFQAYPQSIKYATVQACSFSPDILLRTQSQRKQYDLLRERMDSHRDLPTTLENGTETKKLEKTHKRLISTSVLNPPNPQLTNKVYVLVTAGYVMQYSGDGPFDRLPEKVLKLGKESAAFACDLIPGKHWVLQISQSANEDGTVTVGPKSNLLSRLRIQTASARREASSFLLVLESAEEMDSWMTAVRKEIDALGGMKAKDDSIRESTSLEEVPEKQSQEIAGPGHRYLVQRDPNRISKVGPVDSPLQSQYSDSPKIVASDWEGNRSERTVSIADSASFYSSKQNSKRKSVEVASIDTSVISHDQFQLDQLRERSRFSYMSSATSVTGTGTRNTSRNSSPAPNSPLKEGFSPVDTPVSKLRSFHMSPSNTTATRRRSMQPLPPTNEDNSISADIPMVTPQRHSIYGPISPTTRVPTQELEVPKLRIPQPPPVEPPISAFNRPANNVRFSTQPPVRFSVRSSSAPPTRNGTISPPPRDPAPPPNRRQSTIGSLPTGATLTSHAGQRMSQTPKLFPRLPVKPRNADGSVFVPVPRRNSSLAPLPLPVVVNRSVTTPARPPSTVIRPNGSASVGPTSSPQSSQQLRRPASVQVRSDHAPFLSSSRPAPVAAPVRAISSTPSFVPGNRASSVPEVRPSPSIPALRQQAQRGVVPRRSMPVIGLPPPAPPPNMPLPPPPPVSAPRALAV